MDDFDRVESPSSVPPGERIHSVVRTNPDKGQKSFSETLKRRMEEKEKQKRNKLKKDSVQLTKDNTGSTASDEKSGGESPERRVAAADLEQDDNDRESGPATHIDTKA